MVPSPRYLLVVPLMAIGLAGAPSSAVASVGHPAARHCARHHRHHGRCAAAHPNGTTASSPAVTIGPCTDTTLMPTSSNLAQVDTATLCLVNQQRVANGLEPLKDNAKLDQAATYHSGDMIANNYFDHNGPAGDTLESRLQQVGYIPNGWAYILGENIAAATGRLATPQEIVTGWMNSPEHRANILTPDFRDSGVGVAIGVPSELTSDGLPGATYTQDLGAVAANG